MAATSSNVVVVVVVGGGGGGGGSGMFCVCVLVYVSKSMFSSQLCVFNAFLFQSHWWANLQENPQAELVTMVCVGGRDRFGFYWGPELLLFMKCISPLKGDRGSLFLR